MDEKLLVFGYISIIAVFALFPYISYIDRSIASSTATHGAEYFFDQQYTPSAWFLNRVLEVVFSTELDLTLVNLHIHAMNSVLLFLTCRKLIWISRGYSSSVIESSCALLASIFALHPSHQVIVLEKSVRPTILILLSLLGALMYATAMTKNQNLYLLFITSYISVELLAKIPTVPIVLILISLIRIPSISWTGLSAGRRVLVTAIPVLSLILWTVNIWIRSSSDLQSVDNIRAFFFPNSDIFSVHTQSCVPEPAYFHPLEHYLYVTVHFTKNFSIGSLFNSSECSDVIRTSDRSECLSKISPEFVCTVLVLSLSLWRLLSYLWSRLSRRNKKSNSSSSKSNDSSPNPRMTLFLPILVACVWTLCTFTPMSTLDQSQLISWSEYATSFYVTSCFVCCVLAVGLSDCCIASNLPQIGNSTEVAVFKSNCATADLRIPPPLNDSIISYFAFRFFAFLAFVYGLQTYCRAMVL